MLFYSAWMFLVLVTVTGAPHNTEEPLSLVGVQVEGFLKYEPDGDGGVATTGYGGDFLEWISRYAKFKYQPVDKVRFMADLKTILKREQNRTIKSHTDLTGWDSLLLADLVLLPMIITSDYFALGDTIPLFGSSTYMILPYPQEEQKVWAFVNPFTLVVWVCLACTAFFTGGVLHLFNRIFGGRNSFPDPYMYILQVPLGQARNVSTTKLHYRLVALSWCVAALILSNVYLSLVVTAFSAPFRKPVAETLQEFMDRNLLPILIKQSYPYELFKSSAPGTMLRTVYTRSSEAQNCLYQENAKCLDAVTKNPYSGTFVTNAGTPPIAVIPFINTGKCSVAPFVTTIPDSYLTWFVVRRNHSRAHSIKIAAMRAAEYGLPKKFSSIPIFERLGCPCCNWKYDRSPLSKLGLKDLISIFAILAVSYFVGSIIFVIEFMQGRRQRLTKLMTLPKT